MSLVLLLVLMSLAAYRLWRLWASDILPPFKWARERVETWVEERHGTDWADGVQCSWCSGFWCSVIVVGLVWTQVPLPLPALWFAAVSAAVGFLAQYDEG